MKRTALIIFLFFFTFLNVPAQDGIVEIMQEAASGMAEVKTEEPKPIKIKSNWTNSNKFDVGLSHTGLFNWAAGGNNTVALRIATDTRFDYVKDLMSWNNRLQLEFGFLYSSDKPWPLIQKNSDLIYLESKWAYKTAKDSKWKYAASFDFRSQFAPGYDYTTPTGKDPGIEEWKKARTYKSDFLSPAYTNLALGVDWTPTSWLTLNMSPVTGGFTIVTSPALRKDYGMDLWKGAIPDEEGKYKPTDYQYGKFQFGAQIKADVKFVVNKVFLFESQLVLFTDYLHEPYIRVNWDNKIEWQIHKLFKLGLYTWLIYDPWVMNGDVPRGVQFKESVTLNFTYSFAPELWAKPRKSAK